ncbi:MAG: hypothetical protein ACXQS5_06785 [Candidatus Methanospirareceae archaeon]
MYVIVVEKENGEFERIEVDRRGNVVKRKKLKRAKRGKMRKYDYVVLEEVS